MEKPYRGLAWHAPDSAAKKKSAPAHAPQEEDDWERTYPDGSAVNECWDHRREFAPQKNCQTDQNVL